MASKDDNYQPENLRWISTAYDCETIVTCYLADGEALTVERPETDSIEEAWYPEYSEPTETEVIDEQEREYLKCLFDGAQTLDDLAGRLQRLGRLLQYDERWTLKEPVHQERVTIERTPQSRMR